MDPISLAQAGVAAVALAGIIAIIRGDLVPGYIYKREQARGDRNDALMIEVGSLLRDVVKFLDMPPPDDGKGR